MEAPEMLKAGLRLLDRAVEEDEAGNAQKARELYLDAVQNLIEWSRPRKASEDPIAHEAVCKLSDLCLRRNEGRAEIESVRESSSLVPKAACAARTGNAEEARRLYREFVVTQLKSESQRVLGRSDCGGGGGGGGGEVPPSSLVALSAALRKHADETAASALRAYELSVECQVCEIKHFGDEHSEAEKDTMREAALSTLTRAEKLKAERTNDDSEEGKCMTMNRLTSALDDAIRVVTAATEADRHHRYEEAVSLYEEAGKRFEDAVREETASETAKGVIRAKADEYEARAEKLRRYLIEREDKRRDDDERVDKLY